MFSRDDIVKVQFDAQGLIELQTLFFPFNIFFIPFIQRRMLAKKGVNAPGDLSKQYMNQKRLK